MDLAGWIARGRAAFPALAVDDATATAWFAARVTGDQVPAEDLYLACACSLGSDAAVETFANRHLPKLRAPLRNAGLDDAAIAEVEQALIALVFVGDDGTPYITSYAGRGSLQRWLESIAVRMALRRRERDLRHDSDDALAELAAPDAPRLREHADTLRAAFAEAMAALTPRERTLLRQHHLDGVSLDALAASHRVHRATVARWLAAARESVAAKTRAALAKVAGLATAEIDSLVRSQLDLSIRRHLHD